jgi:hypothetical protein
MLAKSWRLDRQHPRKLFDIRDLPENEGLSDDLRRAFLIYLISHDRPISEVLAPTRKNITQEFAQGFEGMTTEAVALDDLVAARETLIASISGEMPDSHRRFLLDFKRGSPDWDLLDVPGASELPAVRWKQINLDKLSTEVRARLVAQLASVLKLDI